MTHKQFFRHLQVTRDFGYEAPRRVQEFMRRQGFLEDREATPESVAAALIFMGTTASESDLNTFGRNMLLSGKDQHGETLFEFLTFLLSDELKAVCIERMVFDRVNAVVVFDLVDGTDIVIRLNLPIQNNWQERPAIELSQSFLISMAMGIKEGDYIEQGEIVNENKP